MNVYIAMWSYDYEGSGCIVAFRDKADAEAFIRRCHEYHATKPAVPSDYMDNDPAFEAYCAEEDKWREGHPAKDHASCDSFHVQSIELK